MYIVPRVTPTGSKPPPQDKVEDTEQEDTEQADTERADTERADTELAEEVIGSRGIFTVLIAVSALLAVLFLLSLLVIAVLCLCILRLSKQMDGMKGMQHAIWRFHCHYCSWRPECVLGPVQSVCVGCTTLAGDVFFI